MNDLTDKLESRTQQLRELVLLERPGGGMGEPAMHVVGRHRSGGRP